MAKGMKLMSLGALLTLQLAAAGCMGSGGGSAGFLSFLSSLFGGGDSSSVVSTLADGDVPGIEEIAEEAGEGLTAEELIEATEKKQHTQVATLVNPEPGSMALFGGGLGALAVWRRRRARKAS